MQPRSRAAERRSGSRPDSGGTKAVQIGGQRSQMIENPAM
jgi:hypothetical protein